jgi:SAM-dependent methyltransferase
MTVRVGDDRRRDWEARHLAGHPPGRPSAFVADALDVLADRGLAPAGAHVRRALDLACGSGRHALLLGTRGYRVVAIDWARAAIAGLQARARAQALAIDGVVADVTRWPVPVARFDVVVVVDFLERDLLPALRAAVVPGGALIMETFRCGHERYGRPRDPAYLLRPGEIRDACRGWRVLAAHEADSGGAARAVRAGIVAVRPLVDSAEPFGSYPRR